MESNRRRPATSAVNGVGALFHRGYALRFSPSFTRCRHIVIALLCPAKEPAIDTAARKAGVHLLQSAFYAVKLERATTGMNMPLLVQVNRIDLLDWRSLGEISDLL